MTYSLTTKQAALTFKVRARWMALDQLLEELSEARTGQEQRAAARKLGDLASELTSLAIDLIDHAGDLDDQARAAA